MGARRAGASPCHVIVATMRPNWSTFVLAPTPPRTSPPDPVDLISTWGFEGMSFIESGIGTSMTTGNRDETDTHPEKSSALTRDDGIATATKEVMTIAR